MNDEIDNAAKNWVLGVDGKFGLARKLFYHCFISGAYCFDKLIFSELSKGIDQILFLLPEQMRWHIDKSTHRYKLYQKIKNLNNFNITDPIGEMLEVNTFNVLYRGLSMDSESPYGVPLYISSLRPINVQNKFRNNMENIAENAGMLGWLKALVEKPMQEDDEDGDVYQARLQTYLTDIATDLRESYRKGVNVGYKEDHDFEFTSTTSDAGQFSSLNSINQRMMARSLKTDPIFMGEGDGMSETMITILFTKMLSQIGDVQSLVGSGLDDIYTTHLLLKGFKFKTLKTVWDKTTITDELKFWQANEIKQRVLRQGVVDGLIDRYDMSTTMGWGKPIKDEPLVPMDPEGTLAKEMARKETEKKKDASDRKVRDKNKPQGTIRKNDDDDDTGDDD